MVEVSESEQFKQTVSAGKEFLQGTAGLVVDGFKYGKETLRKNDSLLIILSTNSKKLSNEIIKNLLQEENTKSFIYNTDDIIKELIYKNQFDSCNIINLYDGQNIDNIIKNLQFKRDFIVEKLLKIIIVIDEKNLEKLKENAFDFFSTNSFSYSFHDHSFKTSLDEVNRKTLDERINEYKSYTVALNINQNPRVIISLLSSIADEAAKISLYEEASEYLQKALKKAKEEKFSYEEASIKSNLGVCYQNLGDINKALKYCEEAKKISKQIGDIEGVASSLGNIGVIYKIKGDLDKALNYLTINSRRISGAISVKEKDFYITVQDIQNIGLSEELTLGSFISMCSASLNRQIISQLAVLGEMEMSGTIYKVDDLANVLQVCVDTGAKKALIPMANLVDLAQVPPQLMSSIQPIFYNDPIEAVLKSLGIN